jgi:hypothetical protein
MFDFDGCLSLLAVVVISVVFYYCYYFVLTLMSVTVAWLVFLNTASVFDSLLLNYFVFLNSPCRFLDPYIFL